MQRFVAFLRAINVGGHTVKMDHLRKLFESLGLSNVETFIASGNVIFETPNAKVPSLEKRIERHLHESLGYEVGTFLRSPAEIAAIAERQAFPAADAAGSSVYIAFLRQTPTAEAQRKLLDFRSDVDELSVHDREVYWLCRGKMSDSAFSGALLERTLGLPATLRNVTTVKRLAARYCVAP
jgi:uncharacterized protein (DUF1697 family)